jgi:acyl-lipid omega-6 desaturase (Delta-12 desaturase)
MTATSRSGQGRALAARRSGASPTVPAGATQASPLDARSLATRLRAFAKPSHRRSLLQLTVTATAFVVLWFAMWAYADDAYVVSLLLSMPAAALMVRLFVIQHDCGHGSYFRARWANDLIGRLIGIVTLTPYDYWRRAHAMHHATSGDLSRRGIGDITTLTVSEYRGLGRWRRLAYRLYRHPLVLFGIGPAYLFLVKHRWPRELPILKSGLWPSLMLTNASIVAVAAGLALAIGPLALLKLQLPIVLLASSMGVWLFFVQHQFGGGGWWRGDDWSHAEAALHGSSYYRLPRPLQWLTANIGLHHVHHLCSRVPNYRLQECLDAVPDLKLVGRVTLMDSLRSVRLSLWDEEAGCLVGFREARHAGARSS